MHYTGFEPVDRNLKAWVQGYQLRGNWCLFMWVPILFLYECL